MKKSFVLGLLAFGLSMSSCNKDEAVAPAERLEPQGPAPQEEAAPLTVKEQKEALVKTVEGVTEALSVPDLTNILDITGSFVSVYDEELEKALNEVMGRDGFNPYILAGRNFVYDTEQKAFVETLIEGGKDCVIKFLNSKKDTITFKLDLAADTLKFYEEDEEIKLPSTLPFVVCQQIKKTEKKDGKDVEVLVDSVVANATFNPSVKDLNRYDELSEHSTLGLNFQVNYDKYGVALNELKIKNGGSSCASATIKSAGKDIISLGVNADAAFNARHRQIDYVNDASVKLSILDNVSVEGKLASLNDLMKGTFNAEQPDTEDGAKAIASVLNKQFAGTQITIDGNVSNLAFEPIKEEDSEKWDIAPVIKFSDGTMFDLRSDVVDDAELSKIEEILEKFADSFEEAVENVLKNLEPKPEVTE